VAISGVAPADRNTVWAVGDDGTILRTEDGGQSWVQQASGTTADLWEVSAVDSQTAWISGNADGGYAVVLHTTNGGDTWVRQGGAEAFKATTTGFIDFKAVNAKTAWGVGQGYSVVKTTDGGATWKTQMGAGFFDNNGVCAVNSKIAWIAADQDVTFRTVDGGKSWARQYLSLGGNYFLLGVSALGPDAAWMVGGAVFPGTGGVIAFTPDAGATWQVQTTPVSVMFRRVSFVAPEPPPAPASASYGPVSGGTTVRWTAVPGAIGYKVYASGHMIGAVGPTNSSLFARTLLGPRAGVEVVTLGAYGTKSAATSGTYGLKAPVKICTVHFKYDSSKLSPGARRSLKARAKLIAAQGFKRLHVDGYTANRDRGILAYRQRLSLARAKAVEAYLAGEFRHLGRKVSIMVAGRAGANPVGSNATAVGAAKNRRAELLVR